MMLEDCRFDPESGRLWCGDREVKVTPRALALLAVLAERDALTAGDGSEWGQLVN
jgi:hypothetical protein